MLVAEKTLTNETQTAPTAPAPRKNLINSKHHRDDEWSVLLEKVATQRCQAAFSELFKHFAPLIKGFCVSNISGINTDNSDELVQEVLLKVWRKAESFDAKKSSASTWIFTVMRNTRIDYLRKHSKHSTNVVDGLEADDVWDESLDHQPFVYLQQSRDTRLAREQLKTLPIEQADCLRKVYLEGKSHSEISQELELPLGTVKSRVRLGLKKLQAASKR